MERRRETSCSPLQILARNSDVWEIVESIRGIEGGFWTLLLKDGEEVSSELRLRRACAGGEH